MCTGYYRRRVSFNDFDVQVIDEDAEANDPHETVSKPKPILKNKNQVGLGGGGDRYRKKSLVEMTDEEILQLDSQFATRKINMDDFRFENEYSIAVDPFSSSKLARRTYRKQSTDYPTKPLIRANSLCFSFQHPQWSQKISNGKFYLVLISSKESSLGAVDYYLDTKSSNGDTVVICCSINDEKDKNEYLPELMDMILAKFYKFDADLKVQINFEFFRNVDYLRDILDLYNPTAILVGSNYPKRRSGSVLSSKTFVPLIYVNVDYDEQRSVMIDSPSEIRFKHPFSEQRHIPFVTIDEADEQEAPPKTLADPFDYVKRPEARSSSAISSSSSSNASVDSLNSFRKLKTNETSHSLLFDKLNDLPFIEDQGFATTETPATKVKSLLGDDTSTQPVKIMSNSSGHSPFGSISKVVSPVGSVGSAHKLSLSAINPETGMATPSACTKSNSIVDQYNRRMSVQKRDQPEPKPTQPAKQPPPARKQPEQPQETKNEHPPPLAHEPEKKGIFRNLVVGSRHSATAKRLLSNNCAGGLVVDVKVSSTVSELFLDFSDDFAVGSKNGTRESVLGGGVDLLQNLVQVLVNVHRQQRTKEFGAHERMGSIFSLDNSRLDEVAFGVVVETTGKQSELWIDLDLVNGGAQFLIRILVDHRTHELVQTVGSRGISWHDVIGLFNKLFLELGPHLGVHVQSRGCRAFLALVLESSTDSGQNRVLDVGRLVHQMEVLSACFSNDSWEVLVLSAGCVVGDVGPQIAENLGGPCEMQSVEVWVGKYTRGDFHRVARNEVDHSVRESCFFEDLHKRVVGQDGVLGWFPDNRVTHQSWSPHQVSGNGCEIERSHSINKSFQRSILDPVPNTVGGLWRLCVVQLVSVFDVETQKVGQFCNSIDFRLVNVFSLAEHGGCQNAVSVLCRDQIGRLVENGRSVVERCVDPVLLGRLSSLDRRFDVFLVGQSVLCNHLLVVSRVRLFGQISVVELLVANHQRNLGGRV